MQQLERQHTWCGLCLIGEVLGLRCASRCLTLTPSIVAMLCAAAVLCYESVVKSRSWCTSTLSTGWHVSRAHWMRAPPSQVHALLSCLHILVCTGNQPAFCCICHAALVTAGGHVQQARVMLLAGRERCCEHQHSIMLHRMRSLHSAALAGHAGCAGPAACI
jgi:hypothetical protein